MTAPLRRLTEVAGAVEQGEPGARAAVDDAPGEIGQVSRAFDRMAQALDEVYSRDGQAVVEVRDTGPGIPEQDLPHVFERFWRGRAASTVGGRGIGLAVVDELARAHGGAVSVASTLGKGSVFTVHIPLG